MEKMGLTHLLSQEEVRSVASGGCEADPITVNDSSWLVSTFSTQRFFSPIHADEAWKVREVVHRSLIET